MNGQRHALTDVSDSRTVIRLSGSKAREVIARGCSLDLRPGRIEAGACLSSTLARCHVVLWLREDGSSEGEGEDVFDIFVHRSFAEYAWEWLVNASRPFGYRIETA